jgi:cathepsin C
MGSFGAVALAASLAALGSADLPVHCLRHQLLGDWTFELGPSSSQRSSCGHGNPDAESAQPSLNFLETVAETKHITLNDPNTATSSDQSGTWTMIYDEGFEVKFDDQVFFAFSKFDLVPNPNGGDPKNVSHCDASGVGWYHNRDRSKWGCYRASKKTASAGFLSTDARLFKNFLPPTPSKSEDYDLPTSFAYHQHNVDRLNLLQTTWTAKNYPKYVGRSVRQINKMAGIRRSVSPREHLVAPSLVQQSARTKRRSMVRVGDDGTLDWRQKDGKNYLEPVIDQGDCGSCYVVATTRMLTSRLKLKTSNPDADPFSISFPLYCAEYNQGCGGGYAFLASKWSEDVGLLPANCARYSSHGKCQITCDKAQMGTRYRADNHHYVGGFYGAANSGDIMSELVSNGPLVLSFEPKNDLMYYSGGVYKSTMEGHQEWERVDHAVLLVGYGEDAGQKYWTLQNSWGPEWGEHGFFRMARDENDSGIESIAVAADVVEDDKPDVLESFVQGLA